MEPGRSVVAVSLPWCNTQLFAQKQGKKKVSQKHIRLAFCSIILHFRVNTQENLNRGKRGKEGGGFFFHLQTTLHIRGFPTASLALSLRLLFPGRSPSSIHPYYYAPSLRSSSGTRRVGRSAPFCTGVNRVGSYNNKIDVIHLTNLNGVI